MSSITDVYQDRASEVARHCMAMKDRILTDVCSQWADFRDLPQGRWNEWITKHNGELRRVVFAEPVTDPFFISEVEELWIDGFLQGFFHLSWDGPKMSFNWMPNKGRDSDVVKFE